VAEAALAILLVDLLLVERLLRTGRGRTLAVHATDRGTIWLTTLAPLALLAGAAPVRLWLEPGRVALGAEAGAAGLALMGTGVALRVWAMRTLGEFFTRTLTLLPDQHLVVAGPYRVVRHPGYLAQIAVLVAGSALVSLNAWVVSAVGPLLLAAYAYRIRAEERMLESRFGEAYRGYRARTWRLIPGLY
jgi:protein-S-isoprenylcysteine O-methyltransferase Ste14